jgi:hypothetical protein
MDKVCPDAVEDAKGSDERRHEATMDPRCSIYFARPNILVGWNRAGMIPLNNEDYANIPNHAVILAREEGRLKDKAAADAQKAQDKADRKAAAAAQKAAAVVQARAQQ